MPTYSSEQTLKLHQRSTLHQHILIQVAAVVHVNCYLGELQYSTGTACPSLRKARKAKATSNTAAM